MMNRLFLFTSAYNRNYFKKHCVMFHCNSIPCDYHLLILPSFTLLYMQETFKSNFNCYQHPGLYSSSKVACGMLWHLETGFTVLHMVLHLSSFVLFFSFLQRHGHSGWGRVLSHRRSYQGPHHCGRQEHLPCGDREVPPYTSQSRRCTCEFMFVGMNKYIHIPTLPPCFNVISNSLSHTL